MSQQALGTSAEHQGGSEGDRAVSLNSGANTHTHTQQRAQDGEGHSALVGVCVFFFLALGFNAIS